MNIYRFEIYANGFLLKVIHNDKEENGLRLCKRYITQFQKQVANIEIKIRINKREEQKNNWKYHGKPYLYVKTLVKKPRKAEANPSE
ncbi:hypothetical protein QNH38_22365 [Paenibacillus polymyxa]|uniref:hypothetical protein n=1 Tax=Paenibacillus polymyxa TaxID=1406 RepID=UPI0024C046CC|nr:hypothetical protein [Paenibacillus polymyxa]WHX35254.1 hypothetical protein QNH38_22365 [Paenibacillus polymyxa]